MENGHVSPETEVSLTTLRIGIIGGGLGGLACALALQQAGLENVTVFEKDECFSDRREGFGLTLTNNKKGSLAKLGILDECIANDCASFEHWVFRPDGRVVGYYGRGLLQQCAADHDGGSERGNIRIPRQQLRHMFLSKLAPQTVRWGKKLECFLETVNGIQMTVSTKRAEPSPTIEEERINVDVLIGADGLRSVVRGLRDDWQANAAHIAVSPLLYLGVSVIIGLSTANHDLVKSRGFYVLDGVHRLFVMPYQADSSGAPLLTMWQLSFSGLPEAEAQQLRSWTPSQLKQEALRRTDGWIQPVQQLIEATSCADTHIWGTPLFDRDAMKLMTKQSNGGGSSRKRKIENVVVDASISATVPPAPVPLLPLESCVTVLGDACHPMSMFKGQGCNQALEDGPLLASWLARPGLTKRNLCTRLRCFEREMISRTSGKVLASRDAAQLYHSPQVFDSEFGIEGVPTHLLPGVICKLHANPPCNNPHSKDLIASIKDAVAQVQCELDLAS